MRNLGVLGQLAGASMGGKGRPPPDRSFYTYGAPPRPNSGAGGPGIPGPGAVSPPINASGPASGLPGVLRRAAGGAMPGAAADTPPPYAGGALRAVGGVRGAGSGREDLIDAQLSDGEWVADAETVALLGDGSTEEGIRRLEEMRRRLREHKGPALARGKLSPNAKAPEDYMGGE